MEAAYILAKRGHEVTLVEREGQLGGSARLGSLLEPKREFSGVVEFLGRQLKNYDVNVLLNQEDLKKDFFDTIIIATGAKPILPPMNLNGEPYRVLLAKEVLQNKVV